MSEYEGTWVDEVIPGQYHGYLGAEPDKLYPWMAASKVVTGAPPSGSYPLEDIGDATREPAELWGDDESPAPEERLGQSMKSYETRGIKVKIPLTDRDRDKAKVDMAEKRRRQVMHKLWLRVGLIWAATYDTTGIHGVNRTTPSTKFDAAGSSPKDELINLVKAVAAQHNYGATNLFLIFNEQVGLTLRGHSNFNSIGGIQVNGSSLVPLDDIANACGAQGVFQFPGMYTTSNRGATTRTTSSVLGNSVIALRVGPDDEPSSVGVLVYRPFELREFVTDQTPHTTWFEASIDLAFFAFTETATAGSTIPTSGRLPTVLT